MFFPRESGHVSELYLVIFPRRFGSGSEKSYGTGTEDNAGCPSSARKGHDGTDKAQQAAQEQRLIVRVDGRDCI
jgi:hypothetical protein